MTLWFGIGIYFYCTNPLVYIQKYKMGNHAVRCATSVYNNDWSIRFIGWKVTVISSNFIALMLILNMAMNIHLTVRFLQLKKNSSSNKR